MKIVLVSKCSLDIEQYVEFKISVMISNSKSLISSRWVTYLFYIRHSYIHCLLIGYVKRFLEKSRNFVENIIMIMLIVFD